jgi:hypothetical protein
LRSHQVSTSETTERQESVAPAVLLAPLEDLASPMAAIARPESNN